MPELASTNPGRSSAMLPGIKAIVLDDVDDVKMSTFPQWTPEPADDIVEHNLGKALVCFLTL